MAVNKRLLQGAAAAGGLVPSEHFGVVLYEGDGSSSHSINGGKFGAAAYFNGSNTDIDLGSNMNLSGNSFSISLWLANTQSGSTDSHFIGDNGPAASRTALHIGRRHSTGKLTFAFYLDDLDSATNVTTDGTWQHWVCTYDASTNSRKIYLNGSLDNSDTTGGDYVGTSNIRFGRMVSGSYGKGKMDQVRIFQRELSSSEVSTLYAETASTVESLDPLSEDTTDTLQVLGDSSCIATYRFENDEVDLSGNYDGTGTAIQYAAGRYGQAASFNDSSYINVASGSKPDLSTCTVSFWIKTNETANTGIIGEGYSSNHWGDLQCNILGSTGVLQVRYGNASTTDGSSVTSTSAINTGVWVNCAVSISDSELKIYINGSLETTHTPTVTRAATTNPFTIGALYGDGSLLAGWYLNGEIDQVRIFNKILSAAEVSSLYEDEHQCYITVDSTDPFGDSSNVALYEFENNANDSTGSYNGTASGMTYTTGILGQAGDFDGSGDYVTISATATTPLDFSTENFSISHWVYPHNTAESAIYSSKWSTGAQNNRSYYFGHDATGKILISENPGGGFTSTGTLTQDAWSHVVYVRNASTAYIYINGSLDSSHSRTNTIDQAGTQNIYFGRVQGSASGSMYDGLMDQTRYFNKALDGDEVWKLYAEGAKG